eukprot:74856-Chlamydomonas_euryale.AAC.1
MRLKQARVMRLGRARAMRLKQARAKQGRVRLQQGQRSSTHFIHPASRQGNATRPNAASESRLHRKRLHGMQPLLLSLGLANIS